MTGARATCNGCLQPISFDAKAGTASPCRCTAKSGASCTTAPAQKTKRTRAKLGRADWPFVPTAKVTKNRLTLWLPRPLRSREGPNGRSWQAKHRASVEWRELVALALVALEPNRPQWQRVTLHYESHSARAMDRTNILGCCKPIEDALVRGRVMPDDSPEYVLDLSAEWRRSPLPWGFVVVTVRRAAAGKE